MASLTSTLSENQPAPRIGFETLDTEVSEVALPVTGSLPGWLAGSLLRNGPGLFEAGEQPLRHWFDGQAMLHRFAVQAGTVTYGNRFLRSKAYRAARDGNLSFSEFATDPCRSIFKRLMTVFDPQITDNTVVNVAKLGEQHLAMTEAPLSIEFDPETLETLGYGPKAPGTIATAHPHYDTASGALINQATHFGPRNAYRFFVQEPGRPARVLASKTVREPGYVHSFAMSERYIALTEFPFVVDPLKLPLSGKPFIENFRWEPERGTRILVFDRNDGREVGVFESSAGFAFHHVGAWDEGGSLVMDFCDHGSPAIIDSLYLDRLHSKRPTGSSHAPARLRRLKLDIGSGRISSEFLSDQDLELPRINDQHHYLRPYRYVYGSAISAEDSYDAADELVKVDNREDEVWNWHEDGCYPGEPVFVAAPDAKREDDGVVLSVVLDAARGNSFLLVLDAGSWQELARAEAPHPIPHGFHGAFHAAG